LSTNTLQFQVANEAQNLPDYKLLRNPNLQEGLKMRGTQDA